MGPRHYSRGNPVVGGASCVKVLGFNGATTLQSWKLAKEITKDKVVLWFQWGHDITVVETANEYVNNIRAILVSMGPRHYSRGNMKSMHGTKVSHYVSMGPRHYSRGNP